MLCGRLLTILERCGVLPVETTERLFDPKTMKATGFEMDASRQNALVLGEERKGFRINGKCLRPAEVIVNKIEEKN